MRAFSSLAQFEQAVGEHLGYSDWRTITQEQVDLFAEATGDRQWIHVDPVKAKQGPFGATVAHGFLTLSLVPSMLAEIYEVGGLSMGVNYGSNRVRFPSPVPTGSRIRAGAELVAFASGAGGSQAIIRVTVEREGADKPACVMELVTLLVE